MPVMGRMYIVYAICYLKRNNHPSQEIAVGRITGAFSLWDDCRDRPKKESSILSLSLSLSLFSPEFAFRRISSINIYTYTHTHTQDTHTSFYDCRIETRRLLIELATENFFSKQISLSLCLSAENIWRDDARPKFHLMYFDGKTK
jgi:hypothetical protein